jgi:hypothetical protein
MSTTLIEREPYALSHQNEAGFGSVSGLAQLQTVGEILAKSTLVPKDFQNNVPNCMIAANMALRMQADPLMVIQNLYVVHGKPGWSSQFLIATFNQCGRFSSIRFEFDGKQSSDAWQCRACATELATGEAIQGAWVSIALAKSEGWYGKAGSKWKTMPQQMLMYRAASFFVRAYAPEIAMGLPTGEELHDMNLPTATAASHGAAGLQAMLNGEQVESSTDTIDVTPDPATVPSWGDRLKACNTTDELQSLRDEALEAMASECWDEAKIDKWESACTSKFAKLTAAA